MEAANGRSMTALKIFSMTLTYFKVVMHHDGNGDGDSDDYVSLENLFNDTHLLKGDDEQNDDSENNCEDGGAVYKIVILWTVLKIF